MKIIIFAIVFGLSMSVSTRSKADSNIDVMLVFADDIGLSAAEKVAVAGRYQLSLSAVFGGSIAGVNFPSQLDGGNQTIAVWPLLIPEMSYSDSADRSAAEALQWMKNENANLLSPLRVGRETLGNPGADVVIMVVPDMVGPCGAVGPGATPLVANKLYSEAYAFAVIALQENRQNCAEELVVPHEMGHLLFAEHDVDLNGNSSHRSATALALGALTGVRIWLISSDLTRRSNMAPKLLSRS